MKPEIQFLQGPQNIFKEIKFTFRTVYDLIKGYWLMHTSGPCICVFGSARFNENNIYYQQARILSAEIAKLGFTILTGGGPGIMEAANRGAKDAGGRSIGINIQLPFEKYENPFVDKFINIKYFFVRKTMLIKYSYGFIVMPGGFGTMDELFESLTLIQTGKLKNFPIVIFNTQYHEKLIAFIHHMKQEKTISEKDLDLLLITDSFEEAVNHIKKVIPKYNLKAENSY
jgi:uncharacterized protein (TIGR00730 family)